MLPRVKYVLKIFFVVADIVYYFVLNIFLYVRYFSHLHEGAIQVALHSIFSITNEYSGD